MSTIIKDQVNYNLINSQTAEAATDEINSQIIDQAVAAMVDAMNEVLSDSDLQALAELANGSHFESEDGTTSSTDEQVDNLVDTMHELFGQENEPTYELSAGKDLMLQLIAALQESQSKESEASNAVDQAHVQATLSTAKEQASDYEQDLQEMNKKHHWWNKVASVTKSVTMKSLPYIMMAVGFATENPALVIGGAMMLVMSKTSVVTATTNDISGFLVKNLGLPPGIANAVAAGITVLIVTGLTFGVAGAASLEVVADEASAEIGTELQEVGSEEFGNVKEEGSKSPRMDSEKAKTGAKIGFAMSLAQESTTISKGIASLIPEDDKVARRCVFALTETILLLVAGASGMSGMSGVTSEAEEASSASKLSSKLTEFFGEDAAKLLDKVGTLMDFVARNSAVIMGSTMALTGLSDITLSANQMIYANAEAEIGRIQGDLAILNTAEEINQAALSQEGEEIKGIISSFLTDIKFADSMVDARNNLARLLAQ
ncbi:MAG: hypothetical protein KDK56_08880 [Simkania sp.]|nr:hypothetical protein [Simkania sp.]MCP5489577.1 hypothetical protein [Chlamydiales bacterium]